MSYDITYFIGNHRNTKRGEVWCFKSFEELASEFKTCAQGEKHSAYIVRGKLDPVERKDVNLDYSNLLVIDADEGTRGKKLCHPEEVHKALTDLGINHFIYTSHSHSEEQNKFRVIIESEAYQKIDLKTQNASIIKLLADNGCFIKYVKEMNAWTQPWFVPTRDDPLDGMFYHSMYTKGKKWEVIETTKETQNTIDTEIETETLDNMYENIRTGKEYHESMLNISYQLIKDGMKAAHVKSLLRTIFDASVDSGSDRWQERYNDIDRTVDGAVDKTSAEFSVEGLEDGEGEEITSLPIPPGLLGTVYDSALASLLYPYEEVALVSSIGLIAGIIGRRYNVMQPMPMGLNVYMTLVAKTGTGKERIGTFIQHCIKSGNDGLKSYDSFYGPSGFTGPKAIANAFQDARSRVCVVSEAGLMMKVKSGNVEGKTAMILDAYSKSHNDGYTQELIYSSAEQAVPTMRAVAMTIISESTDDNLKEAYRSMGAIDNGYLPRQSVFLVKDTRVPINREVKLEIGKKAVDRLNRLMEHSSTVQAENDPKAVPVYFDEDIIEDMWSFLGWCDDVKHDNVDKDPVKSNMASRMFVKAAKYAGICAVFNSDKDDIKITTEVWDWAKSLVKYELDNVSKTLGNLNNSSEMSDAIQEVCIKVTQLLKGECKNKSIKLTKPELDAKVIPMYQLQKYCQSCKNLKKMGDGNVSHQYKSAFDKVIDYLVASGAAKVLDKNPLTLREGRLLQIKPGFNDFCKQYTKDVMGNI